MKRTSLFPIVIVSAFLFTGCYEDSRTRFAGPVISSYTDAPLVCSEVTVPAGENNIQFTISLSTDGKIVYKEGDNQYEDLRRKHNDYFDGYLTQTEKALLRDGDCYSRDFKSIDVVCNKDYDSKHKAGESLADITLIQCSSVNKWIKNGYKNFNPTVSKSLAEADPEDMAMIMTYRFMQFTVTSLPATKGDYSFTIKMITDNDEEMILQTSFNYK